MLPAASSIQSTNRFDIAYYFANSIGLTAPHVHITLQKLASFRLGLEWREYSPQPAVFSYNTWRNDHDHLRRVALYAGNDDVFRTFDLRYEIDARERVERWTRQPDLGLHWQVDEAACKKVPEEMQESLSPTYISLRHLVSSEVC